MLHFVPIIKVGKSATDLCAGQVVTGQAGHRKSTCPMAGLSWAEKSSFKNAIAGYYGMIQ